MPSTIYWQSCALPRQSTASNSVSRFSHRIDFGDLNSRPSPSQERHSTPFFTSRGFAVKRRLTTALWGVGVLTIFIFTREQSNMSDATISWGRTRMLPTRGLWSFRHMFASENAHIRTHTHTHTLTDTNAYTSAHTHTYTHTCVHMHECTHARVRARARARTHTRTRALFHFDTLTHTHSSPRIHSHTL